jgi:hypothetical protein
MKSGWIAPLLALALLACSDSDSTTKSPPSENPDPAPTSTGTQTTPPKGDPPNGGVFADAPAYTAKLGSSSVDSTGKDKGHLTFNAQGNPAGRPCLSCHDATEKDGAPHYLFAGTIYLDKEGTKPASKIEIRMVDADGKAVSTYSDALGNFFVKATGGDLAGPATAGARDGTMSHTMKDKINDGDCNLCHTVRDRIVF